MVVFFFFNNKLVIRSKRTYKMNRTIECIKALTLSNLCSFLAHVRPGVV